MKVHVADHPLISHKLTVLRDERTDSPTFRRLVEELVTLLAYEATRDVRTTTVKITTPVTKTEGKKMAEPRPVVVPILRAGLGMLEGMAKLVPTAEIGIAAVEKEFANSKVPITLVTGALDEKLNEHGYIVPGLGDAGDRLYGVV